MIFYPRLGFTLLEIYANFNDQDKLTVTIFIEAHKLRRKDLTFLRFSYKQRIKEIFLLVSWQNKFDKQKYIFVKIIIIFDINYT